MNVKDVRQGKRNKERYNIYGDDGFAFSVYAETVLTFGIRAGRELSEEEISSILDSDEKKYALDTALKFLSLRMRSEKEVRDRLSKADVSDSTIGYVVKKLNDLGYLDDRQYAAVYAGELSEKYGKTMIRQKLALRGISRDIIEEVLDNTETSGSLESWTERLINKYQAEDSQKAKQKMIRALMSKGYAYDEVKSAVDRALREIQGEQ